MSNPASPSPAPTTPLAPPPTGTPTPIDNELDAAKAIVASLKGLQKAQQERAIRYASETLGITVAAPMAQVAQQPAGHPTLMPTLQVDTKRPLDIKQFTDAKSPKSDNQFAAVVAYFYRFEAPLGQRRDTINDAVLRDAVRMVGRKRPSRVVLHNAKNRGYLDAVGDGEFRINTVGENLVAVTLPNNDEPVRRKERKKPRRKGK